MAGRTVRKLAVDTGAGTAEVVGLVVGLVVGPVVGPVGLEGDVGCASDCSSGVHATVCAASALVTAASAAWRALRLEAPPPDRELVDPVVAVICVPFPPVVPDPEAPEADLAVVVAPPPVEPVALRAEAPAAVLDAALADELPPVVDAALAAVVSVSRRS